MARSARIFDLDLDPFEELKRRDGDLREEGVEVTGNEQADSGEQAGTRLESSACCVPPDSGTGLAGPTSASPPTLSRDRDPPN